MKIPFHTREPWLNIFVYRYFTVPLAKALFRIQVSPNRITFLSLIFGLTAAVLFSIGYVHFAVAMFLTSYILDAVDGKIARMTGNYSKYGAWFDIFVDRIVFYTCILGLIVNANDKETSVFLFSIVCLFSLGFESRFNIQVAEFAEFQKNDDINGMKLWHPLKENFSDDGSWWSQWTLKRGLLKNPVSLVETQHSLIIVAPLLDKVEEIAIAVLFLLLARLLVQQRFWFA